MWAKEVEQLNRLLAEEPETKGKVYSTWVGFVVAKEVKPLLKLIFLSN